MSSPEGPDPKAVIFGCAGPSLSDAERVFFEDCNPLGFILFARNVETPEQVRALTAALRSAVGRDHAPVLIDQEGGRVQRLRPPHWRDYPAMRRIGEIGATDPDEAADLAFLVARLIGDDLIRLGIDVDCAPVLDVPAPDGHDIIGDRAFSADPETIGWLGRAICEGLQAAGVMPVIKHIPGHGRATADSHVELPRVDAPLDALRETDFRPFRDLADAPAGMTAHVVYSAIDAENPASTSAAVVGGTIRNEIGFDGFLMSDDLCMKALAGPLEARTAAVLAAGCDVALHCDGNLDDMKSIAAVCSPMSARALVRWERARAACRDSHSFDRAAAEARISGVFGS
ncbi:MAG: beta-N-acetylhexosaminidase [Alphaproteobacteria bacterium]